MAPSAIRPRAGGRPEASDERILARPHLVSSDNLVHVNRWRHIGQWRNANNWCCHSFKQIKKGMSCFVLPIVAFVHIALFSLGTANKLGKKLYDKK